MEHADLEQRLEEVQLALSDAFASRKTPSVSAMDDGNDIVLHVSWVTESAHDTTLDSRCAADVSFTSGQIAQYANCDTAQRRVIQERVIRRARQAFDAACARQHDANECSTRVRIDDSLFLA